MHLRWHSYTASNRMTMMLAQALFSLSFASGDGPCLQNPRHPHYYVLLEVADPLPLNQHPGVQRPALGLGQCRKFAHVLGLLGILNPVLARDAGFDGKRFD